MSGIINKIPERVDGVLLICPVIEADSNKRNIQKRKVLVEDRKFLYELSKEERESFTDFMVVQSRKVYERYKRDIEPGIQLANNKYLHNIQEEGYKFSFDEELVENRFDKPSLVLLGRQDSCVGYKDALGILENLPRATFAILDKAGHNLQVEQDEVFKCMVKEWIGRVL